MKSLSLIGGILGMSAIVVFGLVLAQSEISQNIITWILWAMLDGIMVATMIKAGNRASWKLPAGYAIGATFVALVLVTRGVWEWGVVEKISVAGVALSLAVWYIVGPRAAIIVASTAMVIAGIPEMAQAWNHPEPASAWFWGAIVVSCMFSAIGAEQWTIQDRWFPVSSLIFNSGMTLLMLR